MSLAERLQKLADERGVSASLIARDPSPYTSALERIGLDLVDLNRDLVLAAERIDREIFGRILQRVSLHNEFVKKLRELKDFRCQSDSRHDKNSAASFSAKQKTEEESTVAVRVPHQVAIDILKALNYRSADEYNVGLCQKKIDILDDLMEEIDPGKMDKETKKWTDKILEGLKDKVEVIVVAEDDEKDSGKSSGKKSRDDDEDEDEKPSSKRRDDDEDEDDDKPSSKKKDRDEDEDDDKPAPRGRRDDDEDDEDEKPAPKKKTEADDEDLDQVEINLLRDIAGTLEAILKALTGAIKVCVSAAAEKPAKETKGGDEGKSGSVADIVEAILAIVKKCKGVDNGLSTDEIVAKLQKKFPEKSEEQLTKRVDIWIPEKAEKELGVSIGKKSGKWYVKE